MDERTEWRSLTKAVFSDLPVIGPIVLTIGLLTFVFSTILGWSYYGEKAAEYLFGTKITKPIQMALGCICDDWFSSFTKSCLVFCRYYKRTDGNT